MVIVAMASDMNKEQREKHHTRCSTKIYFQISIAAGSLEAHFRGLGIAGAYFPKILFCWIMHS